jgi:hypothetical protein
VSDHTPPNLELQTAISVLNQYRRHKKLDHVEYSLLQRATTIAVSSGGSVSLVSTESGIEFRIHSKPRALSKPKKVKASDPK